MERYAAPTQSDPTLPDGVPHLDASGCPLWRPGPRVLIVDHVSVIGGAELSLETLVTAMPPGRCRYKAVLPAPGPMVERLRARGVTVELVPHESWRWWFVTPGQRARFIVSLPYQALSLRRWIAFFRDRRPDIVHLNINRLLEPLLAAWILRIPNVVHFRDIPSRMSHSFVLGRAAFYAIMNLADCWIANSDATASDIRRYARRPVIVIPNGIDLVAFDSMASEGKGECRSPERFAVAMVALLVPWKNHAAFVELARRICSQRADVNFFVVGGGDRDYGMKLAQLARERGVAANVRFLGHVRNVPALLESVDILVHTTSREPFGRVVLEAMAARRPAVLFQGGGAADIVIDGETGVVVQDGDLDGMAAAVCRLLDDPALRRRMGEAGRRRAEQVYSADRHCEAVAQVYCDLLTARGFNV